MDYLDNDTTDLILQQVPVLDRLQLHKVLNIPKPSQFQVSSELIASKDLQGNNGLYMRAFTTGEYELCVQIMMLYHKRYATRPEEYDAMERYCREMFVNKNSIQRAGFLACKYNQLCDAEILYTHR